jgi:hypothetical protein
VTIHQKVQPEIFEIAQRAGEQRRETAWNIFSAWSRSNGCSEHSDTDSPDKKLFEDFVAGSDCTKMVQTVSSC